MARLTRQTAAGDTCCALDVAQLELSSVSTRADATAAATAAAAEAEELLYHFCRLSVVVPAVVAAVKPSILAVF